MWIMSIFEPKKETASREEIRQIQLERLQATLTRTYRHVPYYRDLFDSVSLLPEDISNRRDLTRLPCTSRADLLVHQPYGLFAVTLHEVLRLHPAAGAGGPVVVGYTRNDIAYWSEMSARALSAAGVNKEDVIQLSLDYSQSASAIGAQSGAEVLGSSVLPCSDLAPERQAEIMRNFRATVLVATPSQAIQLGHVLRNMGPGTMTLRIAFIVGEVWSDSLRKEIEEALQVRAFGSYGLSEMAVPGLASECEEHNGLHIAEDHVLAEIIDPLTGESLPYGEYGELVLTTLTREAVPLLRYRTGDLTTLHESECACGRTLARMEPAHARADDVVIVGGVRLSPAQIKEVIHAIAPELPFSAEVNARDGQDRLDIMIGIGKKYFRDETRWMEQLRWRLEAAINKHLGIRAVVYLVEPDYIKEKPLLSDNR
jgi:phenylacetate-CoA ligase